MDLPCVIVGCCWRAVQPAQRVPASDVRKHAKDPAVGLIGCAARHIIALVTDLVVGHQGL